MNVQHCIQTSFLLLFALTLGLGACSDSNTDSNNTTPSNNAPCPPGQTKHPITGLCRAPVVNPNNVTPPVPDSTPDEEEDKDGTPDTQSTDEGDDTQDTTPDVTPMEDAAADSTEVCGTARISGRACAPSGAGVSGATVTISGIDCATGQPFSREVTTDNTGSYAFEGLPTGEHEVRVTSGSFNQRFRVGLMDGDDQDLTTQQGKSCLAADSTRIAVVGGKYDDVEGLLTELGLNFDLKGDDETMSSTAIAFLSDLSALNQYDIVFINCGELWASVSQNPSNPARIAMLNAIKDYVLGGGSLYASDLAHPFVEEALPNLIDFLGDDFDLSEARDGYAPQMLTATVTDPGLIAALGKNTVEVDFPNDPANGVFNTNWVIMEGALPAVRVFMRGDAQRCPGSVGCSGTPTQSVTNVPLLASYTFGSGGSVVFTSFHNKSQLTLSQDILNTLRYLIFQL